MLKIVLFVEPTNREFETPLKIGRLLTNRFVINEDAHSEIVKILELNKKSTKISWPEYQEETYQKGMNTYIRNRIPLNGLLD